MTEHNHDATTEPSGKPSQAEGERDDASSRQSATESPGGKPSQAEGDREQVEEDLGER